MLFVLLFVYRIWLWYSYIIKINNIYEIQLHESITFDRYVGHGTKLLSKSWAWCWYRHLSTVSLTFMIFMTFMTFMTFDIQHITVHIAIIDSLLWFSHLRSLSVILCEYIFLVIISCNVLSKRVFFSLTPSWMLFWTAS